MELRKETLDLVLQHLGDERKLDRACFEMAVKGEQGCDIVCDEGLKDSIRKLWIRKLQQHGSTQENLEFRAPGQPFYLRLLKELLAFSGDVDREFLMQGERGFPVGVDNPLPRTPHVFENKLPGNLRMTHTCRKRFGDPIINQWRPTKILLGSSLRRSAKKVMERLTLAEHKFGRRLAISSLAVLVEENHQGKRRVIHDATHGTKINNRIKCSERETILVGLFSTA